MAEYFDMSLKEQITELMKTSGRDINLTDDEANFLIRFVGLTAYLITYKCMEKFNEITVDSLKIIANNTFTDSIDKHMIKEGEKLIDLNKDDPNRVIGVVIDVHKLFKENEFPWYGIKDKNAVLMFNGIIQFMIEDILDREDGANVFDTIMNDKGYKLLLEKLKNFY